MLLAGPTTENLTLLMELINAELITHLTFA